MTPTCGAVPAGRKLRDAFGRELHYLRLSVTDRCNFRCVYCLPQGCPSCALLPIGWPLGRYGRPPRRPVEECLFWERYAPPS